jgi:hypothetical protein
LAGSCEKNGHLFISPDAIRNLRRINIEPDSDKPRETGRFHGDENSIELFWLVTQCSDVVRYQSLEGHVASIFRVCGATMDL